MLSWIIFLVVLKIDSKIPKTGNINLAAFSLNFLKVLNSMVYKLFGFFFIEFISS